MWKPLDDPEFPDVVHSAVICGLIVAVLVYFSG